jgi:hypothetical protein
MGIHLADGLFTPLASPQHLLLTGLSTFVLLLVALRCRRALRLAWRRRPSVPVAQVVITSVPEYGAPTAVDLATSASTMQPVPSITPVRSETRQIVLEQAAVSLPVVVPAMPVHAGPAIVPRARPRPRPMAEDSVLSPDTLLARARDLMATGSAEDAAIQLRLCVRLASKLKQSHVEADARLELGDLAQAGGDLTTACEHWQMARTLFSDLKRVSEAVDVEGRMERAGCPTDWVLTKF